MYINGKVIFVNCPGMEVGGMKENGGEGEFKYDILRISVNTTMYPHPEQ
jgi:hypothetical protein